MLRELRSKQKLPVKATKIELKLRKILKINKIIFISNKSIYFKDERFLTQPDIFIEPNICIYADGDYWHRLQGRVEKDERINKLLKKYGYIVIRFWEKEIHTNIDSCFAKIKNILNSV